MGGASAEPNPQDWLPPSDPNVASLFVTGVEDDLPEHELRKHFSQYGQLRSLVCSHRAHCAYVNYVKREDAETAAGTLKGKVVIKGCPMRVTWGKLICKGRTTGDRLIATGSCFPSCCRGGTTKQSG